MVSSKNYEGSDHVSEIADDEVGYTGHLGYYFGDLSSCESAD
jgi:hypothetical protein